MSTAKRYYYYYYVIVDVYIKVYTSLLNEYHINIKYIEQYICNPSFVVIMHLFLNCPLQKMQYCLRCTGLNIITLAYIETLQAILYD